MPPKNQGSAKKKLTKAEKEKLKKEEAERKIREEDEAKQRAEQEEREREEQERLQSQELKKQESEEKKRRMVQLVELNDLLEGITSGIKQEQDERRKNAKWARYMLCDGSPDPTIPGEINTYINLRLESMERVDIASVTEDSKPNLALIDELEFILADTPSDQVTESEVMQMKETIHDLQKLLKIKLDACSYLILLDSSALADSETNNLQYCVKNDMFCLCLWANMGKNSRLKSHEFTEKGFKFEFPTILAKSNCVFRILFTEFDHYSPYCKTYYPRTKPREQTPIPEAEEEKKEEDGEEKKEGDEEGEPVVEREITEDVMTSLLNLDKAEKDEQEEETKEETVEEEEDMEFDDPVTPGMAPKPDICSSNIKEPTEWIDFDEEDSVIDLRATHVVGGVFHFDLLTLPHQPKTMDKWMFRQVVAPPMIEKLDYIVEAANVSSAHNKDGGGDKEKKDDKTAISVTMKLPDNVLFSEEPQLALWIEKNKSWCLDGFTDIKYDEENRVIHFKTVNFGTMALLQDAHINMPFQSWEIRPRAANQAVLTIIAAIVELEIEIKEGLCCLSKPDDKPELQHLKDKWLTPPDLVKILRRSGVNVFPDMDSSKYVSVQKKSPIVEDRLYQQMALTSSAVAYSWSKWNGEGVDHGRILLQGAECLRNEPILEEDWCLFMATKNRTMKLKMTEFDDNFSEETAEGTIPSLADFSDATRELIDDDVFHADLYHLLKDIGSDESKQRIDDSSKHFVDCVRQLLSATKVLTYS